MEKYAPNMPIDTVNPEYHISNYDHYLAFQELEKELLAFFNQLEPYQKVGFDKLQEMIEGYRSLELQDNNRMKF